MIDIYFEEEYGKLNELIEHGKSEMFEYEDKYGKIKNLFMKRAIPIKINDKEYFDIITPYGYGGPIICSLKNEESKSKLCLNYMNSFKKYCCENNIVCEFIRFHPMLENYKDFENIMDIENIRETVATRFNINKDFMKDEFHKSARKTIKKAFDLGLTYRIIEQPEDLSEFIKIYYDTMNRNGAKDIYYFRKEYFGYMVSKLKKYLVNINVYDNKKKCIASGIYFKYGKNMHAHLSGTLNSYLKFSPAYILKYAAAKYGKENGCDYIHYGGGTSNYENDPLLIFKKKFTKKPLLQFSVGKNIYMEDVYDRLVKVKGSKNEKFFPKYRA